MTIADSRVPQPEECVSRYVLDRRAEEHPHKVFIRLDDGTDWTYAQFRELVIETAAALRSHGVKQYDFVIVWLPNGLDAIRLWFAINYLGAVFVPINTAYKGKILEHAINKAGASLMVAHPQFVERLEGLSLSDLNDVITVHSSETAEPVVGLRFHDADTLRVECAAPPPHEADIMPRDTQKIIYTSGTTGPSKVVLCSYAHLTANCEV
ncbi:MAG: AMP-binding protein, partial [Novosphingobium sp.]